MQQKKKLLSAFLWVHLQDIYANEVGSRYSENMFRGLPENLHRHIIERGDPRCAVQPNCCNLWQKVSSRCLSIAPKEEPIFPSSINDMRTTFGFLKS